ncbi:hypothetical protein EDB87DRAFT_373712 [Lactarius vividus]|nr:hypothetical protein EDB87DRAFT_373712 [Lactarius vividus]
MIGHYNLFLGGVLHRDVSSGNIIHLREPVKRFPGLSNVSMSLLGLPDQDAEPCRGFLIDGDHAIEWRKDAITPSLERSGTLTFMSTRLLDDWRLGRLVVHTAIDDLELFLWVLVWALVRIFKTRNFLEIQFRNQSAKRWRDKVFRDLIRDWLRISEKSRTDADELQETLIDLVNGDDGGDTSDVQKMIFDKLDDYQGVL